MDDIYSTLVGAAPAGAEQAAVINALRRRRAFGELASLTGDKVLQPFGQNAIKGADADALAVQEIRQRDADNAQTKSYQDAQIAHMKNVLAETRRRNTFDHMADMMGLENARDIAGMRAGGTGKPPRLRATDITSLQENAAALSAVNNLDNYLNSGGKFGAVEAGGVPIPFLRESLNAAAARGFGSKDSKEAFSQKQEFDRAYTLAERNNMFGATLTENEQKAWRDANPSVAQTDDQLKKALPIMRKVYEHRLNSMRDGLTAEGYTPEAIDSYAQVRVQPQSQARKSMLPATTGGMSPLVKDVVGTMPAAPSQRKSVNGKNYVKIGNQWYEE